MLTGAQQTPAAARAGCARRTAGDTEPVVGAPTAPARVRAPAEDGLTRALRRAVSSADRPCDPLRRSRRPVLQRTVAFAGREAVPEPAELLERLVERGRVLLQVEREALLERVLTAETVAAGLARMRDSAVDYGTFDLDHDQDLALLYLELRKQVALPRESEFAPESETVMSRGKAARSWLERYDYRHRTPNPVRTYDVALLGTGASIAYWITANKQTIDPEHTIVIGQLQPWAHERGPGVVNHPAHMITAIREEVGLGTEALMDRGEFSRIVRRVIDDNVPYQRDAWIHSVKRAMHGGAPFYEIDVTFAGERQTYYARKVVAGLGIGGHALPRARQGRAEQVDLGRRAMNMDEFQRRAREIDAAARSPADVTVVIAGPNAGIDAVKTAMGYGFDIVWVTGSKRPAFLPGTDNEPVERAYDDCLAGRRSPIRRIVRDYAYQASLNPAEGGKPIVVDTGKEDAEQIPADLYVWAQGPDVSLVRRIFASEMASLVPVYDEHRQFGGDPAAAVIGLQSSGGGGASLEIVGGAAFRLVDDVPYDFLRRRLATLDVLANGVATHAPAFAELVRGGPGRAAIEAAQDVRRFVDAVPGALAAIDAMADERVAAPAPHVALDGPLATLERWLGAQPAVRPAPQSVALARRLRGELGWIRRYALLVARQHDAVRTYLAERRRDPRTRASDPRQGSAERMQDIISSLPLNVLVNDQLTPTRSQIEARAGFVPGYVRRDANFATDSQTVLQIHIAVNYPNLSDEQVDEWVDRTIRWRRPSEDDRRRYTSLWGPLPNPYGASREDARSFTDWFRRRLAEEDRRAASR